MIINLKKKKK